MTSTDDQPDNSGGDEPQEADFGRLSTDDLVEYHSWNGKPEVNEWLKELSHAARFEILLNVACILFENWLFEAIEQAANKASTWAARDQTPPAEPTPTPPQTSATVIASAAKGTSRGLD